MQKHGMLDNLRIVAIIFGQGVWGGARSEQTEPEPGEWKHGR